MMQMTTLTSKWQMTLPKQIREALDIRSPGKFLLEVVDLEKKYFRLKKTKDILDLAGKFKAPRGKNALRAREMMAKNYQRF
ncbi:AbrB/MazE/SpoVT family DNA-binding domain-containing protein [Patescibacteria group bacterium]